MSLSQSLFSAISGLINHQTRLDNVGNNLANINTVGYKQSVLRFQDVLSQTLSGGMAPDASRGGTNPNQIGLGMQVAKVDQDFRQGGLESTGRASDLAVEGDGFFKVTTSDTVRYTRDGSFSIGSLGDLLTAQGFRVQGWNADINGTIDTTSPTEGVIIPLGAKRLAKETDNVFYTGNLNSAGDLGTTGTVLASVELRDPALVPAVAGTTLANLRYNPGAGWVALFPALAVGDEITVSAVKGNRNVSENIAYTGQTVAAFAAQVRDVLGIQTIPGGADATAGVSFLGGPPASLQVTGNVGELNAISQLEFRQVGGNTVGIFSETTAAVGESAVTSTVAYDSLGNQHMVTMTMSMIAKTNDTSTWRWYADSQDDTDLSLAVGTGTVTFDSHGQFLSDSGTNVSIDLVLSGVSTALVVNPDFTSMTQFANASGSELNVSSQDGAPMGVLTSYSIGENGVVTGLYSNGLTEDLAKICVTRFANNNGLMRAGGSMFSTGPNSGLAQDGEAQASGRGSIRAGTLESSNVDMAKEFTDMIVTQRGFQANARTITTSDTMLQELINLIR